MPVEPWKQGAISSIRQRRANAILASLESATVHAGYIKKAVENGKPHLAGGWAQRLTEQAEAILTALSELDAIREAQQIYESEES